MENLCLFFFEYLDDKIEKDFMRAASQFEELSFQIE